MKVAAGRSSLARPGNAADLGGNLANHYLSEGCTSLETKVGDAFGGGQPRKLKPTLALERWGPKTRYPRPITQQRPFSIEDPISTAQSGFPAGQVECRSGESRTWYTITRGRPMASEEFGFTPETRFSSLD
jgi:hypothetical protein